MKTPDRDHRDHRLKISGHSLGDTQFLTAPVVLPPATATLLEPQTTRTMNRWENKMLSTATESDVQNLHSRH